MVLIVYDKMTKYSAVHPTKKFGQFGFPTVYFIDGSRSSLVLVQVHKECLAYSLHVYLEKTLYIC